jgi:hypothetical protein
MIPAHQRQRGDGRCPVGVSSSVKPLQAIATPTVAGTYRATRAAAGAAWATPLLVAARVTPAAASDSPRASRSQPTGCRGRRLATTAPTVAVLTAPSTGAKAVGFKTTSSGRPVWRSN